MPSIDVVGYDLRAVAQRGQTRDSVGRADVQGRTGGPGREVHELLGVGVEARSHVAHVVKGPDEAVGLRAGHLIVLIGWVHRIQVDAKEIICVSEEPGRRAAQALRLSFTPAKPRSLRY